MSGLLLHHKDENAINAELDKAFGLALQITGNVDLLDSLRRVSTVLQKARIHQACELPESMKEAYIRAKGW